MRRTIKRTGTGAVALMVAHNQFKGDFAGFFYPIGIREHGNSRFCFCRAGADKFFPTLDFNKADSAGAERLQLFIVAKIRNFDSVFGGNFKN